VDDVGGIGFLTVEELKAIRDAKCVEVQSDNALYLMTSDQQMAIRDFLRTIGVR
jgi:hypothetical protein